MSGESGLLRQQLEEVRAEMESMRLETDAKLESGRRERAAERAELEEFRKVAAEKAATKASEAAVKEAVDRRSEPALQQPRVQVQQAEQG